ncbi:MAG TPA: hypothetical protein VEB00_15805 [Clostridia bacterium]|nr:hypothetical protein [Clostridia bacterium]
MNDKIIDVLKYFFLTFFSLGLMYYIARSSLNLGLVLLVSIAFTVLYALDKFKVLGKLFFPEKSITSQNTKKDQAM